MKLQDRRVVITGGSDGLGFSLAKAFLEKDAQVNIIGRDKVKLDNAVQQLGMTARAFQADVSKYAEIQRAAEEIGEIDVLINNAGILLEGSLNQNTAEEISAVIDINLKGVIYTTKAFLPKMQNAKDAFLLNISSTSGLKGRENQAVYAASKFGVTGFTESLKIDLDKTNIRVSGFYPGGMSTSLFEKAGTPKDNKSWMSTDEVAEVVIFMMQRNTSMNMDHVVLNKRRRNFSS